MLLGDVVTVVDWEFLTILLMTFLLIRAGSLLTITLPAEAEAEALPEAEEEEEAPLAWALEDCSPRNGIKSAPTITTAAKVALDKNLYLGDACIDIPNINHQRLHYINRVRLIYLN
jgi:hypothetical protein